ncbi:MAG: hypothetical protein GX633_00260 [Clostridiales bacterium]|nr:hypothetical protein [Clostridiales bacterium]
MDKKKYKFSFPTPSDCLHRLLGRVPKYIWITFISACVLGFATHLFMFANKLPNHDDIGHLFSATYGTASGRWFLPTILRLDGNFSMPWLIGTLSVLMLAFSACFTVSVMRIRSALGCILTAAVMVTFPTVAATFSYMFTADAYFLSLALTCAAAYVTVRCRWGFVLGAVLVSLSMGIYQSYFSAAAVLMIGALMFETLDGDKDFRRLLALALKYILALGAGIVIYFIVVKISTLSIDLVDYMGISDMGSLSISSLPKQIVSAYLSYYTYFINNDINAHFGFLKYLFTLTGACSVGLGIHLLFQKKLGLLRTLLVIVLAILYPLAGNIIYVMVAAKVHSLMVYSMCFLLIVPIALMEYSLQLNPNGKRSWGYILRSLCSWAIVISVTLTSYSYYIYNNKAYLKLELCYEQAYCYSTRLISAVESTDGYKTGMPIALVGFASNYVNPDPTPRLDEVKLTGILDMEEFLTYYAYGYFLKFYCGYGGPVYMGSSDVSNTLKQKEAVVAMPIYPTVGSIQIIDKYVVVKLSE